MLRSTRQGPIRCRLVTALVVGPLMAVAMLSVILPTAARADVTITSATTGPVSGDGGTFTVTSTGTITNPNEGGDGIVATSANPITTLTIDGVVGAFSSGVNNNAGSTITGINISGSLSGGSAGLNNSGTVGTISNLAGGSIQSSNFGLNTAAGASIGTLTNAGAVQGGPFGMRLLGTTGTASNSGTISGDYGFNSNGKVGSFTNTSTGVVRGIDGWGVFVNFDEGGTFTNEAGGLIEMTGNGFAAVLTGTNTTIAAATNAGTIRSQTWGLENKAPITSLTNSGTISGYKGIQKNEAIGTLTNTATGLISGTGTGSGGDGIYTAAPEGALVNAGRITGGRSGLYAYYGIGSVTNQNGGVISGTTGDGIYIEDEAGTITNEAGGLISSANAVGVFVGFYSRAGIETLSNAGMIEGGAAGVQMQSGGTIKKLTNSGTIRYAGSGTGPVVFVGSSGVFGDSTGARGEALSSTGSNALLDGSIVNMGTIHHGFTIENQNVTVSAGGGAGTFTNGTLTVTNGNLTFTSGTSTVAAGVSANGGAGTVITDANATVRFVGLANRTANFASIANSGVAEFQQAVAGSLAVSISGTGSVLKTGAGNLTLSGSSTYTGATTVSAGRLSVNGALGNSPVTVLALAELGGSGSIAGPVSVANGGSLSPGNSIQSLATGTATFAAGATFEYEVDSTNLGALSTAADLLVVSGDLNLDPGNGTLLTFLDLATTPNPFVAETTIFALVNYSGNWNGGLFTYGGDVLADGDLFMVGSQLWQIDYNRTSVAGIDNFTSDYLANSKFVAITAVPEPATCIMALAGLACGGYLVRRRRKQA